MRIGRIVAAAVVAVGAGWSGLAAAQPAGRMELADVAAYYATLANDPPALRAVIEAEGAMPDEAWVAMEPHLTPILRDPVYAKYVYERLTDLADTAPVDVLLRAYAGLGDIPFYGLPRLALRDQESFLVGILDMMTWSPEAGPSLCDTMIVLFSPSLAGDAPLQDLAGPLQSLEEFAAAYYVAHPGFLDGIYGLLAAATIAEVHDDPEASGPPDAVALAAATEALQAAIVGRAEALPEGDPMIAALNAAGGDMTAIEPPVICAMLALVGGALGDVADPLRQVLVQGVLSALGEPDAFRAIFGSP